VSTRLGRHVQLRGEFSLPPAGTNSGKGGGGKTAVVEGAGALISARRAADLGLLLAFFTPPSREILSTGFASARAFLTIILGLSWRFVWSATTAAGDIVPNR